MTKMQAEIEVAPENIVLIWFPRWLLSPTAIENIFVDEEKQNASAKITLTNAEDKDKLLKTGL